MSRTDNPRCWSLCPSSAVPGDKNAKFVEVFNKVYEESNDKMQLVPFHHSGGQGRAWAGFISGCAGVQVSAARFRLPNAASWWVPMSQLTVRR